MSDVVLCSDTQLDRLVVAKSIAPQTNRSRLLDEIHSLQKIRSNHVVQIFDAFFDASGNISGVIEEYCEGSDLSSQIGQIPSEKLLSILFQFISGIEEIHNHGIIHRDIKPNNVRQGSDGWLRIIDFGLARDNGTAAATMSQIGTPGFMAPELFGSPQAAPGQSIVFTSAIDIFAFGISAFLLAGGTLPREVRQRPPILPNKDLDFNRLNTSLGSELCALLNSCFSINPNDRPDAVSVRRSIERQLLFDKHRALLNMGTKAHYLDGQNRKVRASIGSIGNILINYDGYDFKIEEIVGDISINNQIIRPGFILPDSCVIAFGGPELKGRRRFVTFDNSHPGAAI